MSEQLNDAKIDEVSTRHVRLNKMILNEFFDTNYTSRAFPLMANSEKFQKFCQAVERLRTEYKKSLLVRKHKVLFPVRRRKTIINPSPSPNRTLEGQQPNTPLSPSGAREGTDPTSPKTPENVLHNEFEAPSAPRKPQQAQARGQNHPPPQFQAVSPDAANAMSPKTPEMEFHTLAVPRAPMRLTIPEMRRRDAENVRSDVKDNSPEREGVSKFPQTPKTNSKLRVPQFQTTPKNLNPSFQVTFSPPNQSGISRITGDKNISSDEIERVNEIIGNLSDLSGAEISGNAIALLTRNTTITPGRYKLYKIMRN